MKDDGAGAAPTSFILHPSAFTLRGFVRLCTRVADVIVAQELLLRNLREAIHAIVFPRSFRELARERVVVHAREIIAAGM